jgi:hypothetical protein
MPSLSQITVSCGVVCSDKCDFYIICHIGKFSLEILFKLSFQITCGEVYENYHYRTDFYFELSIFFFK